MILKQWASSIFVYINISIGCCVSKIGHGSAIIPHVTMSYLRQTSIPRAWIHRSSCYDNQISIQSPVNIPLVPKPGKFQVDIVINLYPINSCGNHRNLKWQWYLSITMKFLHYKPLYPTNYTPLTPIEIWNFSIEFTLKSPGVDRSCGLTDHVAEAWGSHGFSSFTESSKVAGSMW